jgi:hypothetical protein
MIDLEQKSGIYFFVLFRIMIRQKKRKMNSLLQNESKQTRFTKWFLMDFGGNEFLIMNPLC